MGPLRIYILVLLLGSFFSNVSAGDTCAARLRIIDGENGKALPGAELTLREDQDGTVNAGDSPPPLAIRLAAGDGVVVFEELQRAQRYYVVVRFPGYSFLDHFFECGLETTDVALNAFRTVSMIQLIANPAEWDRRHVQVIGYLNLEFEGDALYLHKEDRQRHISRNAIWVNATPQLRDKCGKLNGKYVIMSGVFNGRRTGHMGAYSGTLTEIQRCESWRF